MNIPQEIVEELKNDGGVLIGKNFEEVKKRVGYTGSQSRESAVYYLIRMRLEKQLGESVWVGEAAVETEKGEVRGIWAIKESLLR